MADFYAARSGTIPPLPWTNFALPLSMATAGKTTVEIASSTGLSIHSVRALMNDAGCKSNNRGGWIFPAPKPKNQPDRRPKTKSVLAEDFPFIKTRELIRPTGEKITMPQVSMWAAALATQSAAP